MSEHSELDGTDLGQRRWVRFALPVMVCVDTNDAGDQQVRHVVPLLDDIDLDRDDSVMVYGPDGIERVEDHRGDDAAWQAIQHAGHTRERWVGDRPDRDWGWFESPDDLTAEDDDAQRADVEP